MSQRSPLRRNSAAPRPEHTTSRRRSRGMAGLGVESLESRQLLTIVVNPDVYVALKSTQLSVAAPGVLSNDASSTASAITVTNYTQPANGTLTLNPNGSFTYLPTTGYVGPDQFTYTATDARGSSATGTVSITDTATTDEASVFAGPRLASINSTQGTLLNTVLGSLVGTNLNLTAVDYDGLASGSLNGGRLADALGAELGVTPAAALTTNATLTQVFAAAATAAQADGDTAEATALTNLAASVTGVTAPVQLGTLLGANLNNGSLAESSLNALDLVNGTAQLFNFDNVATTPTPITVTGASLGLPGVVGTAAISAQVVEPPIITTGPAGTMFHSSAVRLRIDLNLTNDNLNTNALNTALQTVLGGGTTVTSSAALGQLSVFTEVAEGQGTIASVDAIANAVTLQATPGLANAYLGNIPNNLFFNRTRPIDPATDLGYGNVGTLNIATSVAGVPVLNQTAGIQLESYALGAAPSATTEQFNAPFPQSQTVTTSATFLTNLTDTLVNNLNIQLSGTLGTVLDPLVKATILPAVTTVVTGAVTPLLAPVLSGVADPALQQLGTGIGELDLTVQAINALGAPAANNDFATTPENQAVAVPVLANDATIPNEPVTVTAVTQPTHGTATINPDGTVTYTPTIGYFGNDAFTYTITDPNGLTSTGDVSVGVLPPPPVAVGDAYTAAENAPLTIAGPGVLANDADPNGLPLTAVIGTNPTRGTVTLNPDGSFTYTPIPGDFGPDTFTYQASNGTTLSAPVTVTVNVQPTLPTTNPDTYTATAGQTLTVPTATGVLANDTDPNGLPLSAVVGTEPKHGTLTLNPNGSLTYVPTAGYVGPDTFTYQARDSNGSGNAATVAINIQPGVPVTNPDTYTTPTGQTLIVPAPNGVLANDTDPNGLPLTAVVGTEPTHGTLTLNPDGSLTYVPTPGYVGPDTFTYHAADSTGPGNTAAVTFNVAAGVPVANPDAYTTTANTTLTVPEATGVLANDTDPNGLPLSAAVATGPTHGTLTLNPDGSLTYTPTAGYVGPDTFTYRATDTTGQSTPATVALMVNAAGTPTVIATTPISGTVNVPVVNAPVVTFTDGDGSMPAGSYNATINYGDGSTGPGTVTESNGVYLVWGNHTYATSNTYPVTVAIAPAGATALAATTSAVIAPAAVVVPTTSSLGGTVYLDGNKNGRDDTTDFGIANIVITLAGTTSGGQMVSMTTTTDASGHYEFDGLATGVYMIQVARPAKYFNQGGVSMGTAGGMVEGESVAGIMITDALAASVASAAVGGVSSEAVVTGYNFGELARANCRLNTPAFRTLLRVGPDGTLPASYRPVTLSSTGPIAEYLPALAALARTRPIVASTKAHAVHATTVHTKVQVQHGKVKPHAITTRHHK